MKDNMNQPEKQIAVFGGTFDPPTLAHEAIIRACLDRPDMDEVWVMPSGDRTDKPEMRSSLIRTAMVEFILEESFRDEERVAISTFELGSRRPTQTADTVRKLQAAYPRNKFWFVFGADSYATMHTWKRGEYLRRNLGMLLVRRPGYVLPTDQPNVRELVMPDGVDMNISSTQVREALENNGDIEQFVSPALAKVLHKWHHRRLSNTLMPS